MIPSPSLVYTHLEAMGRFDEAVAEVEQALDLAK